MQKYYLAKIKNGLELQDGPLNNLHILQIFCIIDSVIYRRCFVMARKANYEEKISAIEAKIEKKHNEIKALKSQLSELKAKKAEGDYKELTDYMQSNNLTAEEVLAAIKG